MGSRHLSVQFQRLDLVSGSFLNSKLIVKMASFLPSFVEMITPKLRAEEEEDEPEEEEEEEDEEDLVDPQETVRAECVTAHCAAIKAELDACNDRVSSKSNTTETCFQEILDFYHC